MNVTLLSALLAERVMGWRVAPDRFLLGNRQWKPRHYFQPTERAADAFLLLGAASADEYSITRQAGGRCSVKIRIAGGFGEAHETSEALAVTLAIARSIGIHVDRREGK